MGSFVQCKEEQTIGRKLRGSQNRADNKNLEIIQHSGFRDNQTLT